MRYFPSRISHDASLGGDRWTLLPCVFVRASVRPSVRPSVSYMEFDTYRPRIAVKTWRINSNFLPIFSLLLVSSPLSVRWWSRNCWRIFPAWLQSVCLQNKKHNCNMQRLFFLLDKLKVLSPTLSVHASSFHWFWDGILTTRPGKDVHLIQDPIQSNTSTYGCNPLQSNPLISGIKSNS